MAIYRPVVKEGDPYMTKLVTYIPIEMITCYTAFSGYVALDADSTIPDGLMNLYIGVVIFLIILTPVWTFFTTMEKDETLKEHWHSTKIWFQTIVATLAFPIWIFALGNPLLKALLCCCKNTNCPDCGNYNPVLTASILLIFTTMLVPLFELIISKIPQLNEPPDPGND